MMTSFNTCLAFFVILSTTMTVSLGQDTEPQCFEQGEVIDTLFLDLLPAEDSQDCLGSCQRMEDCQFFTYYDNTGDCYIFNDIWGYVTGTCDDCVSGSSTCEDLFCWEMGSCTDATESAQYDEISSDQCLAECQNSQECDWFTYDDSTNTCYIYNGDCGTVNTDCTTCYTSQKECYRRAKTLRSTEIMVIGGTVPDGEDTNQVLKFNIESENDDCFLEPYPIEAGSMTPTFLADGKVKVCGGEGGPRGYDLDDCFDYDPLTNTWNKTPSLTTERVGMKSSHVEGPQWLLAGGGNYCDHSDPSRSATTELWDGEKFVAGPTLNGECFDHHCQVSIDPTHVFLTDGGTGKAWILDWDTQEYIEQESMRPKYNPGCGKVINKDGKLEVVVASDGISEIFSLESKAWRSGPDMPLEAHSFAYDQIGDTFVLIGGKHDAPNSEDDVTYGTVYQFDPIHYQWILKPYQLDTPLWAPAVLSIRKDEIQCP